MGPPTSLEALSVDYLDWSYCNWELVIARDQDLCEGAIFYYFLWETVQDEAVVMQRSSREDRAGVQQRSGDQDEAAER